MSAPQDVYLLDDYAFVAWLLQGEDPGLRLSTWAVRNLRSLYEQYQREHDQERVA